MTAVQLVTDPSLCRVLDAAADAREQLLSILADLEKRDVNDDVPPNTTRNHALTLSRHRKQLNARLARLRGLHRRAVLSVRPLKQETSEARQEVDGLRLQLQNLHYEQRHLRSEIAACEEYNHAHKRLPLVPIEDFLQRHPEHRERSEDDIMVARMHDEHSARQALEEQRQQLIMRKQKLAQETTAKKDDLAKLDAELEKWLNGQSNVRKLFDDHDRS